MLRGEGEGAIPASSYLRLVPQSQLPAAGPAAAGCKPQLRVRLGRELGSLPLSPFPLLLPGTAAFLCRFLGTGDLHLLVRETLVPSRKLGVPGMCQLLHALGRGARHVFASTLHPHCSCLGHWAAPAPPSAAPGTPASCLGAWDRCGCLGWPCLTHACGLARVFTIPSCRCLPVLQSLAQHSLGEAGASCPSPLCSCVAGPFIACLLRGAVHVAVLWHTCMLQAHLCLELGGARGCGMGKGGLCFLGSKGREKQPMPSLQGERCSHAGGIAGHLLIHMGDGVS